MTGRTIDADELVTFFLTQEEADTVAAKNTADDSEWTYTVKPYGIYFIVEVADEDGNTLGAL